MIAVLILLIILVAFVLSFLGATLIVWLMARLLMLIIPLSIFEAMLLGTLLSGVAVFIIFWTAEIFSSMTEYLDEFRPGNSRFRTLHHPERSSSQEIIHRAEYDVIPESRFYNSASERTWEKWLQMEIANDIYAEFQAESHTVSNLNDAQIQELAIRLADFGIGMLKRKTARARKLTITKSTLAREVEKNGQRSYDDAILKLAVAAFNMNVEFYNAELLDVIREQAWSQRATIGDDE